MLSKCKECKGYILMQVISSTFAVLETIKNKRQVKLFFFFIKYDILGYDEVYETARALQVPGISCDSSSLSLTDHCDI